VLAVGADQESVALPVARDSGVPPPLPQAATVIIEISKAHRITGKSDMAVNYRAAGTSSI